MSGEPYRLVSSKKAPRNRLILTLYSCGYTPTEIIEMFEKEGRKLTPGVVHSILKSPDAESILKEIEKENEKELSQLFGSANDVVRTALRSADPKIALAGAALFYKVTGRIAQNVNVKHSAEDVVAQLLMEAERRKALRDEELIEQH